MTKKKIHYIYDLLYYAIFMLIPVLGYLIHLHHFDNVTLISFFSEMGVLDTNVIFTALVEMFGTNGYLPLIESTSTLFYVFTYMAIVSLLHLVIDMIMFIPKLAHKYLTNFAEKE